MTLETIVKHKPCKTKQSKETLVCLNKQNSQAFRSLNQNNFVFIWDQLEKESNHLLVLPSLKHCLGHWCLCEHV